MKETDAIKTTGATNIVLTGFMGTGKSTVGRLVAKLLTRDFVDTDDYIEAQHGPISEIFANQGEAAFRSMERQAAQDLADRSNLVIATGGGFMINPENVQVFRDARVFCLSADVEEILNRILPEKDQRPLLAQPNPRAQIQALLTERAATYAGFEQVPTDGRSPEEAAKDIVQRVSPA